MSIPQELATFLLKSWAKHTSNLDKRVFGFKNKHYKAQLMGFVCMEDGRYYPMLTQNKTGIAEQSSNVMAVISA